jgi:hypothetical protein
MKSKFICDMPYYPTKEILTEMTSQICNEYNNGKYTILQSKHDKFPNENLVFQFNLDWDDVSDHISLALSKITFGSKIYLK